MTKLLTLMTFTLVSVAAHAGDNSSREVVPHSAWKDAAIASNIRKLEGHTEVVSKSGKPAQLILLGIDGSIAAVNCTINGAIVGISAVSEALPVVNIVGTAIGAATNPDYKQVRRNRDKLLPIAASVLGGGLSGLMNVVLLLSPQERDWYLTRISVGGTIASSDALFSNASDCRQFLKRTGVDARILLGNKENPRVLSHQYFKKQELQKSGRSNEDAVPDVLADSAK